MKKKNILLVVEKPLSPTSKIRGKLLTVKEWTKNKFRRSDEVYRNLATNDVVFDCGEFYEIYASYETDAKETLKKFMEKHHG